MIADSKYRWSAFCANAYFVRNLWTSLRAVSITICTYPFSDNRRSISTHVSHVNQRSSNSGLIRPSWGVSHVAAFAPRSDSFRATRHILKDIGIFPGLKRPRDSELGDPLNSGIRFGAPQRNFRGYGEDEDDDIKRRKMEESRRSVRGQMHANALTRTDIRNARECTEEQGLLMSDITWLAPGGGPSAVLNFSAAEKKSYRSDAPRAAQNVRIAGVRSPALVVRRSRYPSRVAKDIIFPLSLVSFKCYQ